MISLGPLAFAAPLALIGLMALPLLWMMLRATPPTPRNVLFAPLALLRRIARTPEAPQTTPLWLILLRLFIATLVILALARPILQPDERLTGDLPLLVVIDNGWANASAWRQVRAEARSRLDHARMDGRLAALVLTAEDGRVAQPVTFADAAQVQNRLDAAVPRAWSVDRASTATRLDEALQGELQTLRFETIWLSDGLNSPGADALSQLLSRRGPLTVMLPPSEQSALALDPARPTEEGFDAVLRRFDTRGVRLASVSVIANDGQPLARGEARFEDGAASATYSARLPLDLRNRMRLVRIDNERSAGAVQLADDNWRRPRIGLMAPAGGEADQPLLSDLRYAREALTPYAEVIDGNLDTLLPSEPAILVMVDSARTEDERLAAFVAEGGMLIRFAGPRLAARGDSLLPVPLRSGGRLFGGAMAWDDPQALGPFERDSPFAGLTLPGDVTISSQVLAEPGPALDARVWARLNDGTPLVTAERREQGWIVLFHVTAGPDWSTLPLSGLFPAMLRRVIALADGAGTAAPGEGVWMLERALDGVGVLTRPGGSTDPIPAAEFATTRPSAATPPGLWSLGTASAALNVITARTVLEPLPRTLPGAVFAVRDNIREQRLAGPLLALALFLFSLDILIALALSGRLPNLPWRAGTPALALLAVIWLAPTGQVEAQAPGVEAVISDADAMDRALEVRLAWVITGDSEIDANSRAGLTGLSRQITARSAIEPGDPRGIDIETDLLLFYPMIYWPVTEDAPALSAAAARRIEAYLQTGGLLVLDTRDAGSSLGRAGPHPGLVRVLEAVDIPPLTRISPDHVLGRTFYLLSDFPGRYAGGEVWVEADPDGSSRDGTSGVVIGSADWAAAWAVDARGNPLAPVEGGQRQRELAYRVGVNLAMYALTGNYKADQVHVPAILERLGRE